MSSILEALKKLDNLSSSQEQLSPLADLKLPPSKNRRDIWPLSRKTTLCAGGIALIIGMVLLGWYLGRDSEDNINQPAQPVTSGAPPEIDSTDATALPANSSAKMSGPPEPKTVTSAKRSLKRATFKQKSAVSPTPVSPASSPIQKAVPGTRPAVPLLEDQNMQMQAISWAVQPENRIAVINAKIVREGDSIGGYRIAEIREDGVIVRKGGTEHKLAIRLK